MERVRRFVFGNKLDRGIRGEQGRESRLRANPKRLHLPAWVILNFLPAIVITAMREVLWVLGATE